MRHDPIFEHLRRQPARREANRSVNFVGAVVPDAYDAHRFDDCYWSGRSSAHDSLDPSYPDPASEDYFEWVDVLSAIRDAGEQFVMMEVGAGYGRWLTNAAAAYDAFIDRNATSRLLIAVEADPDRFAMMHENLIAHGVSEEEMRLFECAVSNYDGDIAFKMNRNPNRFGGMVVKDPAIEDQDLETVVLDEEWAFLKSVPCRRFSDVVAEFEHIDLIDFDVQNEELVLIVDALELLTERVSRLHIGTHSPEVEVGLREVLGGRGWVSVRDFPKRGTIDTSAGSLKLIDGIQSWTNPKFI